MLTAGEDLKLTVILINFAQAQGGLLRWRPLGHGNFSQAPLKHVARGVYTVTVPATALRGQDFEYYVAAKPMDGKALVFPPTAPRLNQTVIVVRPE
jgi:hypothetical protein